MPVKKSQSANDNLVCSIIYDHLKQQYDVVLSGTQYGALRKRVQDILKQESDVFKVARIALGLIDQQRGLFEVSHLNWGSMAFMEHNLGIPDGAWKYSLVAEMSEGEDQWWLDYWLGVWIDYENIDKKKVALAKQKLEELTKDIF